MTAARLLVAVLLMLCGFLIGFVTMDRVRTAANEGETHQVPIEEDGEAAGVTAWPSSAPPEMAAPLEPAVTGAAPPIVAPAPVATLPDFTRVAERTVPVVVNVSSQQTVQRRRTPFDSDPFFQFYFGESAFSRPSIQNSLGSGVIVSEDGYILTNNHVVVGEARNVSLRNIDISIGLWDGRELPAAVVGVDPDTDLALLKVEARDLPVMPWGDSQQLKVAEWVLAIGNPFQLNQTVTLGIVSAVNRTDIRINNFEDFIQTDAAINPGNSGGALVNSRGQLIGINTAIFSQSGGYQGIGFAVASNLARQVMTDLQQYGEVRRGTLRSMQVIPLTPSLAAQLGAQGMKTGAVVRAVDTGSTAARAGVQPGDIIVTFNGTSVTDGRQLLQLVANTPIGSVATVTVIRSGRQVELRVPVEQRVSRLQ